MHVGRWIKRSLVAVIATGLLAVGLYQFYRPAPTSRTEIFKGIFLTVEDLPKSEHGQGRVMIVEVHWDTPGVKLSHRDFLGIHSPDDPHAPHFRLTLADWALLREKPAISVNTTRYHPDRYRDSLPGKLVRTLETLVVDSRVSHIHEHSYLMYWDKDMEARILTRKPPSQEALEAAVLGISLQGIQINEGQPGYRSMADLDVVDDRTFIGVDPIRRILWLFAFEAASGRLMIERALQEGVIFGGKVDSGDGTSLLIGYGAKGVKPHTGIRNRRPLGPYLRVFADPLP